ncbi:hypothetical protein HPP92_021486 [Vanilla planifolia]|uniref:Small-subunit processome Utp12 domain-containing protein n=1 Tax=Vanilla planifolia TaxID=51239 RepID=A0A835Q176_VANPL|nr:hypothetical protein HPP92_021486 [Vanilla planifolia]
MTDSEVKGSSSHKKKSKKRAKSDLDDSSQGKHFTVAGKMQDLVSELDFNEPTIAEKLAGLELNNDGETKGTALEETQPTTSIPSADSVHVMLKQALRAEDHALLLNCLYTNDEKVITKSTALLNPSDAVKLLKSLLSMIELRGTILACALPWLRSLLSQHASSIASQESSLLLLNSLYQLIETRTSTFRSALLLSTCLDCLFGEMTENEVDTPVPVVVFEDRDSEEEKEEEESDNDMESDKDGKLGAVINSAHNLDGSDEMSD